MDNNFNTKKKHKDIGRRGFFKHTLASTVTLIKELGGKPQMSLGSLEQVPEDVIRLMVPVFNKNMESRVSGERLLVKNKKNDSYTDMRKLDEVELFIIDAIDGALNIDDISIQVTQKFRIDFEDAYQKTKEFFFFLARHMICHPAHSHD